MMVVLLIGGGIIGYKQVNASSKIIQPEEMIPVIEKNVGKLKVSVDPRMELLSAIQLISNYDKNFNLITEYSFLYKYNMNQYFEPYKEHKAVALLNEMSSKGYAYDAPPTTMLYVAPTEELELVNKVPKDLEMRAGGSKQLQDFYEALSDFMKISKFRAFYESNMPLYQKCVDDTVKVLEGEDYIADIENYYGIKQNTYNIILTPLFHEGGFGPRVLNENGGYDIYNIMGPVGMEDIMPVFSSKEELRYLIWHEFGHSFVNPVTNKNLKRVNKYKALMEPIQEAMTNQAYPDWPTCVNEHIVRANTARLTKTELGEEAYKQIIKREKGRGFIYIEALANKMEEYELNREKYKDFEAFYPEILKVFKENTKK